MLIEKKFRVLYLFQVLSMNLVNYRYKNIRYKFVEERNFFYWFLTLKRNDNTYLNEFSLRYFFYFQQKGD